MNQAEHDMLVIDAQDGSRRALDALVRLHHRELLRFAFSLCRDASLAQDAVQDAWVQVAGRLRRLDDPRAFRGWAFRAVRWRVMDRVRKPERRAPGLDAVAEPVDMAVDGDRRDRRIDLGAAIAALPVIDRSALQLFYVAGLTIPEVAAVLDIPPGTVKSRLHRARDQLKQHITGEDDEH